MGNGLEYVAVEAVYCGLEYVAVEAVYCIYTYCCSAPDERPRVE